MGDPKAVIKNVDMAEDMQQEAVDAAIVAFSKYTVEKDIAAHLKKDFDKRYGATWHCIVGRNFGSYVTHGKQSVLFRSCFANGWMMKRGGSRRPRTRF